MKKTKYQIFLIVLIMMIGIMSVCIEKVYAASVVQISSHNAKVGDTVTVTITMPDGTSGYNGTISWDPNRLDLVTSSSDGTSGGGSQKVSDMTTDGTQVKNIAMSFKVKAEGEAVVSSNLICSDKENKTIYEGSNSGAIRTATTPNTQTPPKEPNFTSVNETVYTKETCNIREGYSTDSKKVTKIEKGKSIKRIGVGDNGWSKVEYDGKILYMSSQYLTTEKPPDPKFTDVNKTMYTAQECNIRKSFTTDSEKVGYLSLAEEVKVTAEGDNGWSRIEYKGKVAYVKSSFLAKEKPETPENNTIENNTVEDTNIVEENKVENTDVLGELQNKIGVIPEVGKNYAEYMYILVTILALATTLYMNYKARNEKK